jgi:ABC transporter with metal-binding/Fe-S-binding domain ATP-binding protein
MRLACLFSGGKDSTYAAHLMEQAGHEVVCLVTVVPRDPHSWVFHTLNLEHLPEMAKAMGRDLIAVPSSGEEGADLEALSSALSGLDVEGVVTGAIASDYQWDRINGVCQELGLKVFSPLWRKDQLTILNDMLHAGMKAMIVGVYSDGLDEEWLGRILDREAVDRLSSLAKARGMNVSGEGGEYETLVLDSPMHSAPLVPEEVQVEFRRDSGQLRIGRLTALR